MNHKQKLKLARKLSGKQSGVFISPEWEARKAKIAQRVVEQQKDKETSE